VGDDHHRASRFRPPADARHRPQPRPFPAQRLAHGLGLQLDEAPLVGGASDANLTSELTATLDGLGPVGDGAHAADEHVLLPALPERAALLALLLLEEAR
jgi:glutamate carboxypeptidase